MRNARLIICTAFNPRRPPPQTCSRRELEGASGLRPLPLIPDSPEDVPPRLRFPNTRWPGTGRLAYAPSLDASIPDRPETLKVNENSRSPGKKRREPFITCEFDRAFG